MYIKKISYTILFFITVFTAIYFIPFNLNPNKHFNTVNFIILIIIFLLWSASWYFFGFLNILNSDEQEKNRIVLFLVLVGIILFFYNPIYSPEKFDIKINSKIFFLITLINFTTFLFLVKRKTFLLIIYIPYLIQSYSTAFYENFYFYERYPYSTIIFIIILFFIYYFIKKIQYKNTKQ